jgi:hypothetical protein
VGERTRGNVTAGLERGGGGRRMRSYNERAMRSAIVDSASSCWQQSFSSQVGQTGLAEHRGDGRDVFYKHSALMCLLII